MKRIHRRLFRLNEQIARLSEEEKKVEAELAYHRAINEDAQEDAAVGNYIDREEAGLTAADVRRFERALVGLRTRRNELIDKRNRLLGRLPD